MKPAAVFKMDGAGNTFAFVAAGSDFKPLRPRPDIARDLCRLFGVDGALFLSPTTFPQEFDWDFFNSDGSPAEMCGNAARCAGAFVDECFGSIVEAKFRTPAGIVTVRKQDNAWFAELSVARVLDSRLVLNLGGATFTGCWIDTGVPHFVIEVRSLDEISASTCGGLRRHPSLGAPGANITLMKRTSATEAEAVTFERGVENFTASCGTGAVAVGWCLTAGRGSAQIRMPGGRLSVNFDGVRPLLGGPVEILERASLGEELFG